MLLTPCAAPCSPVEEARQHGGLGSSWKRRVVAKRIGRARAVIEETRVQEAVEQTELVRHLGRDHVVRMVWVLLVELVLRSDPCV
jgi:hypothetical protein